MTINDNGTTVDHRPEHRPTSTNPGKTIEGRPLEVVVDERGVERAIRQLKRKIASEGVTKELKRRKHYEKPSVKRKKKAIAARKKLLKRLAQERKFNA